MADKSEVTLKGFVVGIASAVVAGLAIWAVTQAFSSRAKLVAVIEPSRMLWPAELQDSIKDLRTELRKSDQEVRSQYVKMARLLRDLDDKSDEYFQDDLSNVIIQEEINQLNKDMAGVLEASEGKEHEGVVPQMRGPWLNSGYGSVDSNVYQAVLITEVRNSGDVAAVDVRLTVGNARYAEIARPGTDMKTAHVDGVVVIGDLAPREEVTVRVWSSSLLLWSESPTIVHRDGVGKVYLKQLAPKWLASAWELRGGLAWAGLVGGLGLLWVFANHKSRVATAIAESSQREGTQAEPGTEAGGRSGSDL